MTNNSVTDFSIPINAYDDLKTEVSSVRAILRLLLGSNLCSISRLDLYFCLVSMNKQLSDLEKRMEVVLEKAPFPGCSSGN
jgi:hypothetical protein